MPVTINGSGLASGVTSVPNLATFPAGPRLANVNMPVGSVLQVVANTTTTEVTTTSSTAVTTGFSATITPSSTSSKILICYGGNVRIPGTTGVICQTTIFRGGTNIAPNTSRGLTQLQNGSSATQFDTAQYACYLDSPATTSPTTYTVYFQIGNGYSGTVRWCVDGSYGGITLMEIAQ
jgi:hypothetical protein